MTDVRTLEWKGAELPYDGEMTNACCVIIPDVTADTVVTRWKGSFHQDHVATCNNVTDALTLAGQPAFERDYPAYSASPLYCTDN